MENEMRSVGTQANLTDDVYCELENDKENFLWFLCPFCNAAFPKQEAKLVRHKKEAHGIGTKNRRALIISQAELLPDIVFNSCCNVKPTDKPLTRRKIREIRRSRRRRTGRSMTPASTSHRAPSRSPSPHLSDTESLPHFDFGDVDTEDVKIKVEPPDYVCGSDFEFEIGIPTLLSNFMTTRLGEFDEEVLSDTELPTVQERLDYFEDLGKTLQNLLPPLDELPPVNLNRTSCRLRKYRKAGQVTIQPTATKRRPGRPRKIQQKSKPRDTKILTPKRPKKLSSVYKCRFCHKFFPTTKIRAAHIEEHKSEEFPYQCRLCPEKFRQRHNKEYHEVQIHRTKIYPCLECGTEFKKPFKLKRHMETHNKQTFTCPDCGSFYVKASTYIAHKMVHCEEATAKTTDCDLCETKCESITELATHLKSVHDQGKRWLCPECGQSFRNKRYFYNHRKYVHLGMTKQRKFVCETCGQKCASNALLQIHYASHSDAKPFECDICGKCFKYDNSLRIHRNRHTGGVAKFRCNECGKDYQNRAYLRYHQAKNHSTEELEYKFPCSVCGKSFQFEQNCRRHEITEHFKREERKAKKVQCRYCEMMFKSNHKRNRHERVHIRGRLKPGPKPGKARENKLRKLAIEMEEGDAQKFNGNEVNESLQQVNSDLTLHTFNSI